jgi:hypothetical protein
MQGLTRWLASPSSMTLTHKSILGICWGSFLRELLSRQLQRALGQPPERTLRVMTPIFRGLTGALVALAAAVPAGASPKICWIDHVVAQGAAVRVIFSPAAFNVFGATDKGQFSVTQSGDITWLSGERSRQTESGLYLGEGEFVSLSFGPENTCVITFSKIDGRPGVNAHASFAPPGAAVEKSTFIPVE